ncbi:MAG TPA: anthranilate phosphoribosyltransferase [Candidatus Polarisedimenticolaceae bacterium]
MSAIRGILRRLADGHDLTREEASAAMGEVVEGRATPVQIGAFLVALRMKGETVDEIVGCAEAIRSRALRVRCDDPRALDTCGTGGDGAGTFNVSTAVAFVAAACGATVAKHGNHGVSSACGSADVLEASGFDLGAPTARVERSLAEHRVAFLYAPAYHPAVRHAAAPRREIGVRTVFNAIGPMANPAGVKRQVLGIYDGRLLEPVARALGELGSEHVLVVHGLDGLDEISCAAPTDVAEWREGTLRRFTIAPEDAGVSRYPQDAIRGGPPRENARLLREVLAGAAPEAFVEVVALNTAAALVVAGLAADLRDGAARSRRAMRDGSAVETFRRAAAESRGERP